MNQVHHILAEFVGEAEGEIRHLKARLERRRVRNQRRLDRHRLGELRSEGDGEGAAESGERNPPNVNDSGDNNQAGHDPPAAGLGADQQRASPADLSDNSREARGSSTPEVPPQQALVAPGSPR